MHVKKGDTVLVLSGNDKGRTGLVKEAMPSAGRVIVEGVNVRWRHKRPSQQNPKGERTQIEMAIHASNVRRVEEAGGKKGAGRKAKTGARKAAAAKPARKTKAAKPSADPKE